MPDRGCWKTVSPDSACSRVIVTTFSTISFFRLFWFVVSRDDDVFPCAEGAVPRSGSPGSACSRVVVTTMSTVVMCWLFWLVASHVGGICEANPNPIVSIPSFFSSSSSCAEGIQPTPVPPGCTVSLRVVSGATFRTLALFLLCR